MRFEGIRETKSPDPFVPRYQIYNLPFPRFADAPGSKGSALAERVLDALATPGDGPDAAWELVSDLTSEPPFDPALGAVLAAAAERIEGIEAERGEIARTGRSALAPAAQPYQDFIDRVLFALAGLMANEVKALMRRLSEML